MGCCVTLALEVMEVGEARPVASLYHMYINITSSWVLVVYYIHGFISRVCMLLL